MRTSWKLGRVSGIDVYLHPSFFLLFLLPQVTEGGALGVALLLAAFGCVLLHEFGHALMARRFGIGTHDITLYPIGGVARLTRMPKAPGAELWIALAGPAVNFAIVAGLLGLGILGLVGSELEPTVFGEFTLNLLRINLMLGVFNLVPAFPMDGGRVLRAALSGWLGRVRATGVAAGIGRCLAVLFGVVSLLHGGLFQVQVFLALFIFLAAGAEYAGVVAEENRERFDRDSDDWNAPRGYRWVRQGQGAWQLLPVVAHSHYGNRSRWN